MITTTRTRHSTLAPKTPSVHPNRDKVTVAPGRLLLRQSVRPLSGFPIDTASVVIHDLRCPLAALTMNLEFALSELPDEARCDDVREALRDCRGAGARLSRIITNLFDVARAEAGRLVPDTSSVSVRTLLQAIAHSASSDPRARHVSFRIEGYEGEFDLDPGLMGRVLDCLVDASLSNARAGATLALSARVRSGELELRVPTLGAPLSPEQRALAFSKHSPLAAQGFDRGLGLYFCRKAVEAHDGGIGLHEGDDRVTFFRIVIPMRGRLITLT